MRVLTLNWQRTLTGCTANNNFPAINNARKHQQLELVDLPVVPLQKKGHVASTKRGWVRDLLAVESTQRTNGPTPLNRIRFTSIDRIGSQSSVRKNPEDGIPQRTLLALLNVQKRKTLLELT